MWKEAFHVAHPLPGWGPQGLCCCCEMKAEQGKRRGQEPFCWRMALAMSKDR